MMARSVVGRPLSLQYRGTKFIHQPILLIGVGSRAGSTAFSIQ